MGRLGIGNIGGTAGARTPWKANEARQLAGPDLDRLRKQIAASVRERELEHEAEETVALSLGQPMHPL